MCSDCRFNLHLCRMSCQVSQTGAQGRGRHVQVHNVCVFEANRRRWIEIGKVTWMTRSSRISDAALPTGQETDDDDEHRPCKWFATGFAAPLGPTIQGLNTLAATVDSQQNGKYL
ncbi:hypothetical protein KEM48_011708 [Puccinia striiformis f. sp. tritici PST-130]|nr:hypothetical protein KEM48_011708 [Puccinia striiformis f. sp. tritici PST-130]